MKIYTYQGRKNICGEKIREMRVKSRLSQSELAAKVQTEGITLERDSISTVSYTHLSNHKICVITPSAFIHIKTSIV